MYVWWCGVCVVVWCMCGDVVYVWWCGVYVVVWCTWWWCGVCVVYVWCMCGVCVDMCGGVGVCVVVWCMCGGVVYVVWYGDVW